MKHETIAPTDRLPLHMPATPRRERVCTTVFPGLMPRGARYGYDGKALSISDMENLSPRAYPALAVRSPRELLVSSRGTGQPHGMVMMDGVLYYVQGSTLWRIVGGIHAGAPDGSMNAALFSVGKVTDSKKQMVVFGNRLLIFPDKKYVDAADGKLRPMELDSGVLVGISFSGNSVTLPEGKTWLEMGFEAGDGIRVLNCDDVTPAPEGNYCIRRLQGRVAYLTDAFAASYISTAQIKRLVPSPDRLCVSGNRLIGIRGKDVYISAEGTPFCWIPYRTDGLPDGAGGTTLHIDTDGDLTACATWQGYVMIFKSDRICRLLGNRSDSFTLTELRAPGIPAALADTLCELGGALYYHSDSGVYRYGRAGQYPERIGCLSLSATIDGCAGSDGACYYLGRAEANEAGESRWETYVYAPEADAWYREDAREAVCMTTMDGYLCRQDRNGDIWLTRSDGRMANRPVSEPDRHGPIEASVTFAPDHAFEPNGYRPVAIAIRATSAPGGELRVLAICSDGRSRMDAEPQDPLAYTTLACFAGGMSDRLLRISLLPPACDGMILRLEMTGEWMIHSLIWEYEVPRE